MSEAFDRAREQPGLHMAAQEACVTKYTDGFCMARNNPGCPRCWPAAEAVMKATGLSAQAVTWIFAYRSRIEAYADREYGQRVAKLEGARREQR